MNSRSMKIAKICPCAAPTRISAVRVLSRLRSLSRRNSGTMLAIIGIIIRIRIAFHRNPDIGMRWRAKKYAPINASPIINPVDNTEMKMLLARVGVIISHATFQFSQWMGSVSVAGLA